MGSLESDYRRPINPEQDRRLDAGTVEWFCVGCPFLGVDHSSNGRSRGINPPSGTQVQTISGGGSAGVIPSSDSNANTVAFDQVGITNHPMTLINYKCTSPSENYNMRLQQVGSTMGIGFCPFLSQKLDIMYDSITDDGGS